MSNLKRMPIISYKYTTILKLHFCIFAKANHQQMPKQLLHLILFLSLGLPALAQQPSDAILGEWLNQEKDGKIIIFKQANKYFGKISWGKNPRKDHKNPEPSLRSRDLIGLVILTDFSFTGNSWENGKIYDPQSGKTYDCILKIKDKNQTLDIRGYVGMAMFGRTSVWTRVP